MTADRTSALLEDLNEEQSEAVLYQSGPLVVVAGAGSGKTRVLTRRIAYLIAQGVLPEQILAITFTNKAAQEMKSRIYELIGETASGMWISTFHSACVRILRRHAGRIGFTPSFSIYDDSESRRLIELVIAHLNMDHKRYSARAISHIISASKNDMYSPASYLGKASNEFEKSVAAIFFEYQKRLRDANAFDFDDLLLKTVELLKSNEDLALAYQERFYHLLVDEYQDTNRAQNELVALLGAKSQNVCVVGDSDQSIYAFRGANFRNLLNFQSMFSNAKVIVLNQNYRSTQNILDAANAVIEHNESRVKKRLWSALGPGEKIKIFRAGDERYEAAFVANEIVSLAAGKITSYADIAVFYRTNAQSRAIEEALVDRNIAYKVIGGIRFFDRKEIKDILAYMRLIDNIRDEISIRRVINVPKRKIGAKALEAIERYGEENSLTFYEVLLDIDNCPLPSAARSGVKKFLGQLELLRDLRDLPPKKIMEDLLDVTSYREDLLEEADEAGPLANQAMNRLEIIDELMSVAMEHEDLESFLSSTALLSPSDDLKSGNEAVTLMTIHGAKGLEFDAVFLTGMEESLFPHDRAMSDPEELEEERRLCYVGITRARKYLYLTHTYTRTIFGRTLDSLPSRFLRELPKDLVVDMSIHAVRASDTFRDAALFTDEPEGVIFGMGNASAMAGSRYSYSDIASRSYAEKTFTGSNRNHTKADVRRDHTPGEMNPFKVRDVDEINLFRVGDKISHARYGQGVVKSITGSDGDKVAVISFLDHKERKFLLAAAPIKLLQ